VSRGRLRGLVARDIKGPDGTRRIKGLVARGRLRGLVARDIMGPYGTRQITGPCGTTFLLITSILRIS